MMGGKNRILFFLLAALVGCLPFEFRAFPVMSNLQWLFVLVSVAALPVFLRDRKELIRDRLVIAAFIFVLTQWLSALLSDEFTVNAVKGAVRVTAGFTLLCATRCVRDRAALLKIWSISAVLAALYGVLDYSGFGVPKLFRETEFWFGPAMRLSGSFEYPNTAAAFFALSLPIIWTEMESRWLRILGSLLVWIVLIMTYSRGAIIAVLLMSAVWAFVSRVKAVLYFGVVAVGAFTAVLILRPSLLSRFRVPVPPMPFSAEYDPEFNWLKRGPDQRSDMVVRIKNTGTLTWPESKEQPFTLSNWWYDAKRKTFFRTEPIFTPIPVPLRPQESVGIGVVPGVVQVDIQPGNRIWSGRSDVSRWYRGDLSRLFVVNVPYTRTELWQAALNLALQHPMLGVGPDNFRLLYGRQFGPSEGDETIRANSMYFELLSGSGLVGLAAFCVMIAGARRNAGAPAMALAIFLIHGLVDAFLMTTPIHFAFWILLGQAHGNQISSPAAQAQP